MANRFGTFPQKSLEFQFVFSIRALYLLWIWISSNVQGGIHGFLQWNYTLAEGLRFSHFQTCQCRSLTSVFLASVTQVLQALSLKQRYLAYWNNFTSSCDTKLLILKMHPHVFQTPPMLKANPLRKSTPVFWCFVGWSDCHVGWSDCQRTKGNKVQSTIPGPRSIVKILRMCHFQDESLDGLAVKWPEIFGKIWSSYSKIFQIREHIIMFASLVFISRYFNYDGGAASFARNSAIFKYSSPGAARMG